MMSNTHFTPDQGPLPRPGSQFAYFSLATSVLRLLPEQHSLVVNRSMHQMTLVDWQARHFLEQIGFTDQELSLLVTLMDHWPSYVPYEKLFSSVIENWVEIGTLAQRIEVARAAGDQVALDMAVAPISTILVGCRSRLHALGLDFGSIEQYGYRLVSRSRAEVSHEA